MISYSTLADLKFENTAYKNLYIEKNNDNTNRKVIGFNYSLVFPTARKNPKIASLSKSTFQLIDLDADQIKNNPESALYLCGNKIPNESIPLAHCYCGYQFGNWAGQLGDGRAHILGDIRNKKGEIWELQLKGSGKTPYSRFGDGNAVLRSCIREYLCSEAMHFLGIPTTRAASVVVTDDLAERDPLYNRQVIQEKCAVVLRLSPSFLRFGSFEVCNPPRMGEEGGPSFEKQEEMIPKLLDYVLKNHYQEILSANKDIKVAYFQLYKEIVNRTAKLVAMWQAYGFCHGVLNTDNMSILGLTIDYGPFEFIDHFDKKKISNYSDKYGQYNFENQPKVCQWNLERFAEALSVSVDLLQAKTYLRENYFSLFDKYYYDRMRSKLGLFKNDFDLVKDKHLIMSLLDVMHYCGSEFTNTFRKLSDIEITPGFVDKLDQKDFKILTELQEFSAPRELFLKRREPPMPIQQILHLKNIYSTNPMAIQALGITPKYLQDAQDQLLEYEDLLAMDELDLKQEQTQQWFSWLVRYKQRLNQEFDEKIDLILQNQQRKEMMNNFNPQLVLRNYMAEEVIKEAEKGNFQAIDEMIAYLSDPYGREQVCKLKSNKTTPSWALNLCVSCSA